MIKNNKQLIATVQLLEKKYAHLDDPEIPLEKQYSINNVPESDPQLQECRRYFASLKKDDRQPQTEGSRPYSSAKRLYGFFTDDNQLIAEADSLLSLEAQVEQKLKQKVSSLALRQNLQRKRLFSFGYAVRVNYWVNVLMDKNGTWLLKDSSLKRLIARAKKQHYLTPNLRTRTIGKQLSRQQGTLMLSENLYLCKQKNVLLPQVPAPLKKATAATNHKTSQQLIKGVYSDEGRLLASSTNWKKLASQLQKQGYQVGKRTLQRKLYERDGKLSFGFLQTLPKYHFIFCDEHYRPLVGAFTLAKLADKLKHYQFPQGYSKTNLWRSSFYGTPLRHGGYCVKKLTTFPKQIKLNERNNVDML